LSIPARRALKEWKKLDNSIQSQFKKKLRNRLQNPHILSCQLRGFENHYKIKLRASGYRLVYEVIEQEVCVLVIAIGKKTKMTFMTKQRNGITSSMSIIAKNSLSSKGKMLS